MTSLSCTPGYGRQVMFSIVVAGCMLIMGNVVAWPNVITVLIDSNNNNTSTNVSALLYSNDFVLTEEEAGWIASLPTISNIPFVLLSGLIVNLVGLKGSTALGLVLAIVAWLLMGLILSKSALFIGRAISGVALAFIMTVSQSLMSELVSPRIRGFAASLPKLFVTLGSLEINVADIFLPWNTTTVLCASAYAVLLIFILFVPESPYWLVKKGRKDAAVSALKLLYPSADDVEEYFQEVQKCVTLSSEKLGVREQIRQMRLSTNYKPVTLMTIVFACYGSNGYSIILPYSTLLFSQSGMGLDPRLCTIILGVTRFIITFFGASITDLCGRRPLYIGSSIFSVLSLVTTFVSLTFTFIPKVFVMISLMSFIIFSSGGINLVPPILLGELIPSAVQSVGCSLCIVLDQVIYSIFLYITPWLTNTISLRFVFLIPAVTNLLGAVVVWKWVPETKGRTLLELQRVFE